MSAPTELPQNASGNQTTSTIDRVRVRMRRLIHTRDRPQASAGPPRDNEPALAADPVTASPLSRLAADVSRLQEILEDSEKLIRQAWIVAADLNQVRRQCSRCESVRALPEPLGTFQGLLNRWRHNLRTAAKAVDNIKEAVSAVRE